MSDLSLWSFVASLVFFTLAWLVGRSGFCTHPQAKALGKRYESLSADRRPAGAYAMEVREQVVGRVAVERTRIRL